MARHYSIYLVIIASMLEAAAGCTTSMAPSDSRQSDLGLGIMIGTQGYHQLLTEPSGFDSTVTGQVITIEGGAYVIQTQTGREIRLPLDENTSIDRPAHVGDWLEAHLDESGRAIAIRNIDELISIRTAQQADATP